MDCNCDQDFFCGSKACIAARDAEEALALREYRLYAFKDENGKTVDIRDVQFCKDKEGNVKIIN